MRTTIDKAGRVVVPADMRRRLGLEPGTEIEMIVEGFTVRLARVVPGPELTRRGNRLVARSRVPKGKRPRVDVAALIEEERDRWPR
jgi:AbrB family looped-hinge helix DNA binding protein